MLKNSVEGARSIESQWPGNINNSMHSLLSGHETPSTEFFNATEMKSTVVAIMVQLCCDNLLASWKLGCHNPGWLDTL